MKELASITRSTFFASDFHSADHRLAAVGFFVIIEMLFELFVSKSFHGVALEDVLSE